jgi:hypothetical protein
MRAREVKTQAGVEVRKKQREAKKKEEEEKIAALMAASAILEKQLAQKREDHRAEQSALQGKRTEFNANNNIWELQWARLRKFGIISYNKLANVKQDI